VRAILIVNPNATTTTQRTRNVIIRALSSTVDLEVIDTTHRMHATDLARQARRDGLDAVITLGGDGTVNEAVNGLLSDGLRADVETSHVPALGTIPGGSANVFARSLGLSEDPVDATAEIIEALTEGNRRTIGLGLAEYSGQRRYFMCNAGLGIDAEIIEEMDRQRASGASATPARYVGTALTQFFVKTERHEPALTIERPGVEPVPGVFLAIIQNSSPWTYLGPIAVDPCPRASFDAGLDLFAPRSLGVLQTVNYVQRMLLRQRSTYPFGGVLSLHDQSELRITASRATSLQIDGEAAGSVRELKVTSVPRALSVLI
jgi:diacylglycerol kinase family enzyme